MKKLKELFEIVFSDSKILIDKNVKYRTKPEVKANLKKNSLILISLLLFMIFTQTFYYEGFLLSCIFILLIATQISDLKEKIKCTHLSVKIYSLISSFGICFYALKTNFFLFYNSKFLYWSIFTIALLTSLIGIYTLTTLFLNWLFKIIKSLFLSLSKAELLVFSVISTTLIVFSAYTFLNSCFFWLPNSGIELDFLYTSDTTSIVKNNAYMTLFHCENDIRQPLFAVFAAPILGAFYSLSIPLTLINPVFYALLMNIGQILMMTTANLMVIKMLEPCKANRICLMVLLSLTHTVFLSTIMMEQYIIVYFYLILAIYYYITYNKTSVLTITAATGTLFTSALLFPIEAFHKKDSENIFIKSVSSIAKNTIVFIFTILAFCRYDVIINFIKKLTFLMCFSSIKSEEKLNCFNQFLAFVASCFKFPDSAVSVLRKGVFIKITCPLTEESITDINNKLTWQLTDKSLTDINYVGIIILVLCFISAIVNRKNILTKIAALWSLFSVIILGVIGWGAIENGMVLYSLYFCWAYFILLVKLVQWLADKTKCKSIIIIASIGASIALVIANYHGIADLLSFAFSEYPYSL